MRRCSKVSGTGPSGARGMPASARGARRLSSSARLAGDSVARRSGGWLMRRARGRPAYSGDDTISRGGVGINIPLADGRSHAEAQRNRESGSLRFLASREAPERFSRARAGMSEQRVAPTAGQALLRGLLEPAETKMVMVVMDGLGGLPMEPGGPTELEAAATPNLDRLAAEGTVGMSVPVGPGITPGSGVGHLALFGYDPVANPVGRGILEALGIGMEVGPGEVAARGNFCTLAADGTVADRRAGRISTDACRRLVEKLRGAVHVDGVELAFEPVRDYRMVVRFRGEGLGDRVNDTDPLEEGLRPVHPQGED